MIYTDSYFRKELRQGYSENRIGFSRRLAFSIFMGLITFALFFVLQTLRDSVLADAVPQIMQPSYFSTLYIYIHLCLLLFTIYFMVFYDYLFFAEIRKNSWYLLIQMGYRPTQMIGAKLTALLYALAGSYFVGFIVTLVLTAFLKYPFIFAYLPSLFLVGLVDLLLISFLVMTLSLYARSILNGRYLTFLAFVLVLILKVTLGEYNLIGNRVLMMNLINLTDLNRSVYLPTAAAVMLLCVPIGMIRAKNIAKYYFLPAEETVKPAAGVRIAYLDAKTGKPKIPIYQLRKGLHGKMIHAVVMTLLILSICGALLFNIFILIINISAPGQEVAIRGVIPLIFQSNTMEPTIMVNDLAYFRKVEGRYQGKAGDIILFEQDHVKYVERVISVSGDILKVDIDNYPPMAQPGAMQKRVAAEEVYGVYSGRNRWLGALILFANTIVGRILFLLLPAVLLFYHKQILRLFKKIKG